MLSFRLWCLKMQLDNWPSKITRRFKNIERHQRVRWLDLFSWYSKTCWLFDAKLYIYIYIYIYMYVIYHLVIIIIIIIIIIIRSHRCIYYTNIFTTQYNLTYTHCNSLPTMHVYKSDSHSFPTTCSDDNLSNCQRKNILKQMYTHS